MSNCINFLSHISEEQGMEVFKQRSTAVHIFLALVGTRSFLTRLQLTHIHLRAR